jgi:hypothetical protein
MFSNLRILHAFGIGMHSNDTNVLKVQLDIYMVNLRQQCNVRYMLKKMTNYII